MEPNRSLILDVRKSSFLGDRRVPGNRDEFSFSQAEWSLPSYFPRYCTFPAKTILASENLSLQLECPEHVKHITTLKHLI